MKQYTPDSISPAILQHQEVPRSALWATIIGNALEWYDLIVYGFLAVFIAKQFFPDTDEAAALLATFATFALSYVVRPAAGVLIGLYADTAGRRKALMLIMGMMTVAMLIMVVVPPYSSIGLGATVLMVIARLLQAASAAGEFGSAAAYLLEAAPSRRRGLFSGLYSAGPQLACMLSAIVGLVLTIGMSEAVRDSWGWRIPFAVGLLIAPVGLYIRRYLPETNEFVATQLKPHGNPLAFFQGRMRTLLVGTALAGVANSASYILLIYAPTYVAKTLKLPIQFSFISLIVSGIAGTLFMPLMGALADRIGAKRQLNLGLGGDCFNEYLGIRNVDDGTLPDRKPVERDVHLLQHQRDRLRGNVALFHHLADPENR